MMKPLNIIFAGTPDFAAQHLQALLNSRHNVIAVYTQPDKPAGRGKKLQASPVKQLAEQHNIPLYQPKSLRQEAAQAELNALNADVMVVVAYGLILPKAVLDAPRLGCLNVHGSILPRWRGAAPIQRAIWAGDAQTGITIMQMDEGLDTGDMLHKVYCEILPTETSGDLYHKLAQLAPPALIDVLDHLENGKFSAEKQVLPHQEKPAGTVLRADKSGIQVATADGVLNLLQLQPAGKKPMSAQDLLNGRAAWFPLNKILG